MGRAMWQVLHRITWEILRAPKRFGKWSLLFVSSISFMQAEKNFDKLATKLGTGNQMMWNTKPRILIELLGWTINYGAYYKTISYGLSRQLATIWMSFIMFQLHLVQTRLVLEQIWMHQLQWAELIILLPIMQIIHLLVTKKALQEGILLGMVEKTARRRRKLHTGSFIVAQIQGVQNGFEQFEKSL